MVIPAMCLLFLSSSQRERRASPIQHANCIQPKILGHHTVTPTIIVTIRFPNIHALMTVAASQSMRIANLKSIILENTGISVEKQLLIFNGTELNDTKTLNDYKVTHSSKIDMIRV